MDVSERTLKVNIVKSVGLAKLIYSASILRVPKNFRVQVNKINFNFIWDNKIAKLKNNTHNWRKQKRGFEYDQFYLRDGPLGEGVREKPKKNSCKGKCQKKNSCKKEDKE